MTGDDRQMRTDRAPATSLAEVACAIIAETDPDHKVERATKAAKAWFARQLQPGPLARRVTPPGVPGRPPSLRLLRPREMAKRSRRGERGRFALLHALAHIELSAVDMTWDLVARFTRLSVPRAFFDDWVQVGLEESKHFGLLQRRLRQMNGQYGDLPAHDGLWQATQQTGHDLLARLAIVPLVLEARGLDVGPAMINDLEAAGDQQAADILRIIYRDEKRHVACGMRWFRYLCQRDGRPLEPTFQRLVRCHFRAPMKPPFNEVARTEAGLTPGFYKPLTAFGAPP